MCGIAGSYRHKADDGVIRNVITQLSHRGPDEQHVFANGEVQLIHTRLSILELSPLGSQPYQFENLVLCFNGEIYNYQEIREGLKRFGYTFVSNSDTEVLIKAFHHYREKCVDHFIGMFAFSVYDLATRELFIFRDRLGVKPVYYYEQQGALMFASELKALLAFQFKRILNTDAIGYYFRFGFTPQDLSAFAGVNKVKPGHYVKIGPHGKTEVCYWSVKNLPHHPSPSKEQLEEMIVSAFKYRMVSDVPVGVFLSGGIDSTLLTAVLQKHHGQVNTFTIGFEDSRFDESGFARKASDRLGTLHHERILMLDEAEKLLDRFYDIYDEPFADTSGIPTACVTKLAKDSGMKVVLSADGGDELFGGYTHYQKAYDLFTKFQRLPTFIRKNVARFSELILPAGIRQEIFARNFEHRVYALEELLRARSFIEFYEAYIANQAVAEVVLLMSSRPSVDNPLLEPADSASLQDLMDWDCSLYLPDDLLVKVDRATMYFGLESREPFLDHRLVEYAHALPVSAKIHGGENKIMLREILRSYYPDYDFDRKKRGFSIPIFKWFSEKLDDKFDYYLAEERITQAGVLNPKVVAREHDKYKLYKSKHRESNIEKMWRITSFMMWWEKYCHA